MSKNKVCIVLGKMGLSWTVLESNLRFIINYILNTE